MLFFLFFIFHLSTTYQPLEPCHTIRLTHYEYSKKGSCGFGPLGSGLLPGFLYGAAPNEAFYGTADHCGECYELFGPRGSVRLMVVDQCPVKGNEGACSGDMDHFDTTEADGESIFLQLVDEVKVGKFNVSARKVVCDIPDNEPVKIRLKDDMTQYWFSILVFNYKIQVAKVEIQASGSTEWISLPRASYNQWEHRTKLIYPVKVRLTSIHGSQAFGTISNYTQKGTIIDMDRQFEVDSAKIYTPPSGNCCKTPEYHKNAILDGKLRGNWNVEPWKNHEMSVEYESSEKPPTHDHSIKVTLDGYGGFQLGNKINASRSKHPGVHFYIKGTPDHKLTFAGAGNFDIGTKITLTDEWQLINFASLEEIGFPESFRTIGLQNSKETTTFYIDDLVFDEVANDCASSHCFPGRYTNSDNECALCPLGKYSKDIDSTSCDFTKVYVLSNTASDASAYTEGNHYYLLNSDFTQFPKKLDPGSKVVIYIDTFTEGLSVDVSIFDNQVFDIISSSSLQLLEANKLTLSKTTTITAKKDSKTDFSGPSGGITLKEDYNKYLVVSFDEDLTIIQEDGAEISEPISLAPQKENARIVLDESVNIQKQKFTISSDSKAKTLSIAANPDITDENIKSFIDTKDSLQIIIENTPTTKKGLSSGVIAAIVVCCIVGVAIIVVVLMYIFIFRKRKQGENVDV